MPDHSEPKPPHWLTLTLVGWGIHLFLASGIYTRLMTTGPRYEKTYRDYNMALPSLTQQLFDVAALHSDPSASTWMLFGFSLIDLGILAFLARYDRPAWKWWFWGVVIMLMLGWGFVEFVLMLPEWKLREALSR